MAYKKPDVEVYQQFRTPQADISPAVLQSCIIGPLYQIFTDEQIGVYDNNEHIYYFPSSLKPGAKLQDDSFKANVLQYGESYTIAKSNLITLGTEGVIDAANNGYEFVDHTKDFMAMAITLHESAESNDGDYLRIPAGANAGYHKILDIIDSHTLVLASELQSASSEDYEIRSKGYIIEEELTGFSLRLTPYLGFSGSVAVSFKALRTDQAKPFEWTKEELALDVGEDQITPENPLAYGASLALSVLGQSSYVLAMPIASDSVEGYTNALRELEATDAYAITCLTHNMQVAQALLGHANAMSAPSEKRERIAIFNNGFSEVIVKAGYIDLSTGSLQYSGIDSDESVITEAVAFACDGNTHTHVFESLQPTRVSLHFKRLEEDITHGGAEVAYSLSDAPEAFISLNANSDKYHALITAPAGQYIAKISYKASIDIQGEVNAFALQTFNEADYTEYSHLLASSQISNIEPKTELIKLSATNITEKRVLLADMPIDPAIAKVSIPSVQNFVYGSDYIIASEGGNWYVSWDGRNLEASAAQGSLLKISYIKGDADVKLFTPAAGHKALKIRAYDITPSAFGEKPEDYVFPEGMAVHIVTQSGVTSVTKPGTYVFDRDILAVYKNHSVINAVSADAIDAMIELMFLVNAGSISRNKFVDPSAKFITNAKIVAGDKLVINSGASAGEYEILSALSDTELLINTQFTPFESGLSYEIHQGNVTKNELAKWISQVSSSFGQRRLTHIFCPYVGVSPDGVNITVLPGYFYNCVVAGLIHAMAPQTGMTNLALPGFTRVFYVSDYFTEDQLDTIAGGGTFIIMQHNKWTTPYVRHQLTTDMSVLEKKELSCVKTLDYIAKMGRETMRPLIGRYLINEATMTALYSTANAFIAKCKTDGLINSGDLMSIYVDPDARDTVIICIEIEIPVPLNRIRLFIHV